MTPLLFLAAATHASLLSDGARSQHLVVKGSQQAQGIIRGASISMPFAEALVVPLALQSTVLSEIYL